MDWHNHTPPIRGLMALRAVAENGTFTRAARALGWNQPNVSKHLQALERAMGKRLVRRDRAGTDLTADGARVLEQAVRITEAYAELLDDLAPPAPANGPEGAFRIAASPTLGHYWLPQVLPQWQAASPALALETRVLHGGGALRRLVRGQADLALVEQPPGDADLVAERVGTDRLVPVCHPRHPWAGGSPLSLADLLRARLVLREPGCQLRDGLERRLRQEGQPALRPDRVVGSGEALLTHLRQGEHLTVASSLALATEWGEGLVPLPIADLDLSRSLWAVHATPDQAPEGRLANFLAHLRSHPIGEGTPPVPGKASPTPDSVTG